MIKKIIFDLDNTLIIWENKYIQALEKAMKKYNVKIDSIIIDNIIESLEKKYSKISKEILLRDINEQCNLDLTIEFINNLFNNQKELADYDEQRIEIIKYLSNKYELVVLTNYFKEVQEGRLQTAGILKYFKEIYGGDTVQVKPNKEAFITAMSPYKPNECIMIGDSLENDINGALDVGLNVIAFDKKDKIPSSNKYIKIKTLKELEKIL